MSPIITTRILVIKLAILKDASDKVTRFNKIGVHYEAVYHHVIRKRMAISEIYDDEYIDCITAGLISFDMQRFMGTDKYLATGNECWGVRLKNKLNPHRSDLEFVRSFKIQNIDLQDKDLKSAISAIYDSLAEPGNDGLSVRNKREMFRVGATKILHFLIPDLFVIIDSNAERELKKHYNYSKPNISGERYLQSMKFYQGELNSWKGIHSDPNFDRLIKTDNAWRTYRGDRSTPIPRIIDKCTFAGG